MPYSQKYTIVQFLEPVQDQQIFSMENWPLHITLADVFAVEASEPFIDELRAFLAAKPAVTAVAKEDGRLGKGESSVRVTLIENSSSLQALHNGLIDFLQAHSAVFNSPQFTREGFLPHVTHQKHARLHKGDQIDINALSLVDMFVDSNWKLRKILKKFRLNV